MKNLAFIFAHPDDETFACGGTIARYADDPSCRVTLYCATRGEAGSTGHPPLCRPDELGDVREQELNRAASILGLDELYLRNFGDGQLEAVPMEALIADVGNYLEKEHPDAVVTFPPHGISGHPDHCAIQRVTGEAVRRTGRSVGLYHIVVPDTISQSSHIHLTPREAITHTIDVTAYRQQMLEALLAHRTQHISVERVFPSVKQGDTDGLRKTEYYQAIHPILGIPGHSLL
ncbi:PIG-L deacetylase family protein [Desmospora profundinema]|uniref:LmbE family N-acetylglucosaminyl deacetylase n=1 Tax=Desmospora profundinema TaxID=1571184 RepID=A0ABU1IIC8_9BACL|nr:PIG-L family deacetylase [Desmospora profundinema]MDR6224532.1 LmbE family N-acetylglucosaminyl deacetylase [Desmospora profundinema]